MDKKRIITSFELAVLVISLFSFIFLQQVSAKTTTSTPSVCCEKTTSGAWCVNEPADKCDKNFKQSPTSCETTSYCRLGTCYDSSEGICMENTPQRVCESNNGVWDKRPINQVPQCHLGCCILGDQAAFVSLVRCKRLSTFLGLSNTFRTDIDSEVKCIATAQAQDMGACVFEKDFERTCKFTTRKDCGASEQVETKNSTTSGRKFYKGYLCSAEELNTNCARQTSTECYNGKVYWVDSCGNRENVYSSDRDASWNHGRVAKPDDVCSPNDGSNKNCGNCDYLKGSRCAKWDGVIGKPSGSDYYCKRTVCKDENGKERINGESWCVYDDNSKTGFGRDPVGSRHFREICVDGNVVVEPCADFRNEICIEDKIKFKGGEFHVSGCRVNRWRFCTQQKTKKDCENSDKRDCIWIRAPKGQSTFGSIKKSSATVAYSNPSASSKFTNPTGRVILEGFLTKTGNYEGENGVCVPRFPPGLEFWKEGSSQQICSQGNYQCAVHFEKKLGGSWKATKNKECLEESWAMDANRLCNALGDCGGYVNYKGTFSDDGYVWKIKNSEKKLSQNTINILLSGNAVKGGVMGMLFTIIKEKFFRNKKEDIARG